MKNRKVEVQINDRFKLVCEINDMPYDKEIDVYVIDTALSECQDIARISPEYDMDEDCNVIYEEDRVSLKIFADENDEDFTEEHLIPIRYAEEEDELSVSEILQLEEIEVEQNVHNILQCEPVQLGQFFFNGKLDLENCKNYSYKPRTDYDAAYFDYTLKHKGTVVLECTSTEEVEDYINKILAKYKIRQ